MLARMLRLTIALQMLAGAVLGVWLTASPGQPGETVLYAVLGAAAGAVFGVLFTVFNILLGGILSRAKEPAAMWWRAMLGECLASIQLFLLRQPWTFATPAVQESNSPQMRIPVLLVHGFVCNCRLWDEVIPALRAQGHTVLAINLEPVFTSIDDYAPLVEQAVQSLSQHTGQDRVALVGHSMGGLAIRAWMRRFGTAHAAGAITLGTPHCGTKLQSLFAPMLVPPNGLQMAWNSEWLQALAASESDATRSLFRIALSPQDNIVYPQRAQTLSGIAPKVFEGVGHLQLCTTPKVTQWLCSELALL